MASRSPKPRAGVKRRPVPALKIDPKIFERIVHSSSDGVVAFDCDLRYRVWSRSMERFSGVRASQVVGKRVSEAVPLLKGFGGSKSFLSAIRGKHVREDCVFKGASDGASGPKFFRAAFSPLKNEKGKVIGGLAVVRDVTERKNFELALRRAKEFSEQLIRTANVMIVGLDAKGNITVFNEAAERISGYSAKDLRGSSWFEVLVPKNRYPEVWSEFLKLASGGLPKIFENPILTRSGKERWISWQNSEVMEGGKIVGTISYGIDVTEQRIAQLQLKKHQEEQRHIFDSVPAMIWYKDTENRILHANRLAAESMGLTVEEIEGKSTYDLYPEEAEKYYQDDLEVIRSGKPKLGIIETFPLKSGEKRWVQTDKIPYRDEKGNIAGVIVFAQDITAHKSVENQLESSLSLLQATLESTADGILVVDMAGKIVSVNKKFMETWNIPQEVMDAQDDQKAIGYVLQQLMDPPGFLSKIEYLYSHPEQESYDTITFKDGRILERYSKPQVLNGKIIGRVWSFRDTTERIHSEREIKLRAEQLARSNAELEQFAYVASHDLQEPLRTVSNFAELLERRHKDRLDPDALKLMGHIVNGVARMRELINDLLNYSRVGSEPREFESVETEAVLKEALENLALTIKETSAEISKDPLPAVNGDHRLLVALFQNLIGNALKFYNQKPPRIHISAGREPNGWIFSIKDNGIGIETEYLDRIFVIFQRLHKKQGYPGTGIGLAICKKIVERHQGRIWVESQPGQGSTFYFSIPGS